MRRAAPQHQRGVTLFVGLVMLALLLLMAVSAFNLGRTNTAITGNMQHAMETTNAAMQATEQVISSTRFVDAPDNAVPASCGTNRVCVDVNGDGTNDVTVALDPPPCIKKIQVIKNANLDMTRPSDAACALGAAQSLGVAGTTTGDSLCAESVWEITANATDQITRSQATVITGVAVRVAADEALDTGKACVHEGGLHEHPTVLP